MSGINRQCRRLGFMGIVLTLVGITQAEPPTSSPNKGNSRESSPSARIEAAFERVQGNGQGIAQGRGGDTIHSGLPPCDDGGLCKTASTIVGNYSNDCPGSESSGWISLAFPVLTDGVVIDAVHLVHLNNPSGGHLYILGDCGGNPDVNNILYTGCDDIVAGATGAQVYTLNPRIMTGSTVWVVTAMNSGSGFDVAFNETLPGSGFGFGNLNASGDCGNWFDLADVADEELGFCYCVSVEVGEPFPPCCTSENPPLCDGDVNGNGEVDPLDGGFVLSRYGLDVNDADNCLADVNCDGEINPLDEGYVRSRFDLCLPVPTGCAPGGGTCDPGS